MFKLSDGLLWSSLYELEFDIIISSRHCQQDSDSCFKYRYTFIGMTQSQAAVSRDTVLRWTTDFRHRVEHKDGTKSGL